jgi:sugar/nucleoside kinase (ribokinase family)
VTVVVVGSVLLDIIATYDKDTPVGQHDTSGKLDAYRIGGTAYNVAHNLLGLGCKVRIMTYLSSRSFSTNFFRKKLEDERLLNDFVFFQKTASEGAFIAHRRGKIVERAVTSTIIQTVNIPQETIDRVLSGASLLVADCSLSPYQLTAFVRTAKEQGIGVVLLGTSDSKVATLKSAQLDSYSIDLLVVNQAEFRALCQGLDIFGGDVTASGSPKTMSAQLVERLCEALCCKSIIVTLSEEGMVVYESSGERYAYDAPSKGEPIISTTGAGDALSAVVAAHFVRNGKINWDQVNREIKPRVLSTLLFEGATPNCEATSDDL